MNKFKRQSQVIRTRECSRKQRFLSQQEAENERVRRSTPPIGSTYLCRWCDGYHITKAAKQQ